MSKIKEVGNNSNKISINSDEDSSKIDYSKEVNDWGLLVTKHPLRMKIWTLLNIFGELNVTQMSKLVKESKSSISRIAREMREDYLIVSTEKDSRGSIKSKVYRIDNDVLKEHLKPRSIPTDSKGRIVFYRDRITEDRSAIKILSETLSQLHPLLDKFEKDLDKLDEINNSDQLDAEIKNTADKLYTTYFQGDLEPMYTFRYYTQEKLNLQDKLWSEISKKYKDQIKATNEKTEKDFAYYTMKLPLKAIYEFHEKSVKEKV
jgi:hypothetical protein